jgi:prophage DNA circulation protein
VASSLDILPSLLPTSWRGVIFPTTTVDLDINHSTVTHLYPHRDGGRVEGMGRDPVAHRFRIPFLRSIDRGLYPQRFREFVVAWSDGSKGDLGHPELGILPCRPSKGTASWSADKRDGCWVDATWLESTDDGEAFAKLFRQSAPYFLVEERVRVAKVALLALKEPPSKDLFDRLDQAKNALRLVAGRVAQARLSVNNILASVAGFVAAADALMVQVEKTWDHKGYEALGALADAVKAAKSQAEELLGVSIVTKVIPRPMTVEDAAAFVGMAFEEFLRFNARLADVDLVRKGQQVFAAG